MDESQQSGAGEQPGAAQTSLTARLLNVFVAPGEVFAEIKDRAVDPANWITPTAIAMLAAIVYVVVVYSQPSIMQPIREAMDKAWAQKVASGQVKQADADKFEAISEKFMIPTIATAAVLWIGFFLFASALVIWLIGRFGIHGQFIYMKAVEVIGLASMISALGAIVAMLLAVIFGNIAMTPSAILLVGHFDNKNHLHHLLASLNVMTLWYAAVLSIGVGQVSGKGFCRAAMWIYGLWALLTAGALLLAARAQG
jgi:hypothetical protein